MKAIRKDNTYLIDNRIKLLLLFNFYRDARLPFRLKFFLQRSLDFNMDGPSHFCVQTQFCVIDVSLQLQLV